MSPPNRKGNDPAQAKQAAFRAYQSRRSADGFEAVPSSAGSMWKAFVGPRGERLRALLQAFHVGENPRYPPSPETSIQLMRDLLERMGATLPDVPAMRLCEWFTSAQGGRAQGWREVPSGLAQTAANDGRAAVVVCALGPDETLAGVIYPDESSSASNPTVLMVSEAEWLDPGTVLQGFRGKPVRYFAQSV